MQAEVEVEPEVEVVLPAGHNKQIRLPKDDENFPIGQVAQLLPPVPYFPGTQTPVPVHTLLPAGAEVPSGHAVHTVSPELAAIVLAKQDVQLLDPAWALNLPGEQDSQLFSPKRLVKVPALQGAQNDRPLLLENLPGAQRVQFKEPNEFENDPGSQEVQL